MFGVVAGTLFTPFVVTVAYDLVGRYSASPNAVAVQLEKEMGESVGGD